MEDAVVVLSRYLNPDGSICDELRQRVDRGIELLTEEEVEALVMSGGFADADAGINIAHSDAMAEYAISRGVPAERVYRERNSMESVGHAVFVKKELLVPKDWRDIQVVTSDYHIPRITEIFNFILGRGFNLSFEGIPTGMDTPEMKAREKASLEAFHRTFNGIDAGDDAAIFHRLFSAHPRYIGRTYKN